MALPYVLRNIVLVVGITAFCQSCTSPAKRAQARLALQSEMDSAIEQVREIVNQPVTRLVRRDNMQVVRVLHLGGCFFSVDSTSYDVVLMTYL
jgi:hypothetical protein